MNDSKKETRNASSDTPESRPGRTNDTTGAFQNGLHAYRPAQHLVYPLTRGFGYDEDPPPLSLVNVGLEHEVFDPGPRGAGPFEATAQATSDETASEMEVGG